MDRRVVRVRVPSVVEYDVVIDDGRPVFVGAVIRREASRQGPDAGKWIDTHRTTWDGRGGRSDGIERHPQTGQALGTRSMVIEQAIAVLAADPMAGTHLKAPNQMGRPSKASRRATSGTLA